MIVFDLRCAASGHVFEAWFGSTSDYEAQQRRGLVSCPLCGDFDISKAVMAPNVAAKGNSSGRMITENYAAEQQDSSVVPAPVMPQAPPAPEQVKEMLVALAKAQTEMLKKSDWVGGQFAENARAMHYGETEKRAIHGEVSTQQAKALLEDGIDVAPLPFPVLPPEAQN